MGKLIVEQWMTADGFGADTDGGLDFVDPADGDAIVADQLEMLSGVDAIILGANTYRMFAAGWPLSDDPVAKEINRLPKHVITSTLEEAPWGDFPPAIVEHGDAVEAVRRLKEQYDGELILWGSFMLTDALFTAGLVDILRVRTVPALLGSGRSIAPEGLGVTRMTLADTKMFSRGRMRLRYELT